MDQRIARDLVSVFRQIDELRGIVQIIEPAPPCGTCGGFGKLPSKGARYHVKLVCPSCGGSGWQHQPER